MPRTRSSQSGPGGRATATTSPRSSAAESSRATCDRLADTVRVDALGCALMEPVLDWTPAGEYVDIRYETAEGIAKVASTGPRCATPSDPSRCASCPARVPTGPRRPGHRRRRPHRRGAARVLLGRRSAGCAATTGTWDETGIARLSVDLQVGSAPAEAGDRHGRGLRDRRQPRPPVCCDLTVAADNAQFGQTGPRVGSFDGGYGINLLARQVGEKQAKEMVPLPSTRRRRARVGAGQRGRPARAARGGDRGVVPQSCG